jgi:hypothetical protein
MEELKPFLAWFGVRPFAARRQHRRRTGNARLVALSGLVLLALLPVPYVSAVSLDLLWRVHFFSSLVLIPLLIVKFAGTGWRALRYYIGDAGYRADGPPHPMARLSAPVLVISTIVLFVSGVVMMLDGDRFAPWSTVHNGAAIVFTGALGLHLLAHLWDAPADAASDLRRTARGDPGRAVRGGRGRIVLTVAAFVLGITVATIAMPSAQWTTARPADAHHRDG